MYKTLIASASGKAQHFDLCHSLQLPQASTFPTHLLILLLQSTNDEDEAVGEGGGSEENHEYFKFLQNEKEGSLLCAASLFHSHTPQLVPVKRYYTHLTEPAVVGVQVFLMQQNV